MSDKKDIRTKLTEKLAEMKEARHNTIACGRCGVYRIDEHQDSDYDEGSDSREHACDSMR